MNVNDIICVGAEPLALVNYLALERMRPELVKEIMIGLQKGAREAGVAIVSGETAMMSDVIRGFDLAATVVGLVKKDRIITGSQIRQGDLIFGIRSSGIHSNGLTLARKLLLTPNVNNKIARELLRPTAHLRKASNATLELAGRNTWFSPYYRRRLLEAQEAQRSSKGWFCAKPYAKTPTTSLQRSNPRDDYRTAKCTAPSTWALDS